MSDPASQNDGLYSMRVVTRMTGLTADTIRAWERRYAAVEPERTSGNTRRFSASDVRRLMALRDATERGHSIGAIANLPIDELENLAREVTVAGDSQPGEHALTDEVALFAALRDGYLRAVTAFDTRQSWDLLHRAASLLQPRDFVYQVALPVLQEVGRRWEAGDLGVAQEHLVSAQLGALLNRLVWMTAPDQRPLKFLMTTPAGHTHYLGLLVGAMLTAARGFETIFLGPNLPDEELVWAVATSGADVLIMSVVRDMEPAEIEALRKTIDTLSRQVKVWIGTYPDHEVVKKVPKARYFHRFEDLDVALADLST